MDATKQGTPGEPQKRLGYRLVVQSGEGPVTELDVGIDPITIGRAAECDLRFDDLKVSRQHCLLHLRGGRLTVLDQGSTHGTVVNGVPARHARLSHGDVLRVGSVEIFVEATGSEEPVSQKIPAIPERWTHADGDVRQTALSVTAPGGQLRLVYRLGALLANSIDMVGAADAVIHLMLEAFPVDRAVVLLASEDDGEVRPFAAANRLGGDALTPPPSETVISKVLESGTALHSLDVARDRRLTRSASLTGADVHVVMCAPLRHGDDMLGVLYADAKQGPMAPSEDKLALFEAVADQAALALGRARLHSELVGQHELIKQQRDQLEALSKGLERRVAEKTALAEERAIELAERLSELEQLQAARETMAQCLVHDVRNMVGAIDLSLQYLAMTARGSERAEQAAGDAQEVSRRILSLVEDVLAVSRMEAGVMELSPRLISVAPVIAGAVRRNSAVARDRSVELAAGAVEPGLALMADPALIERVLDNLVGNALRYAGDDGTVALSARFAGSRIELVVTDTGPGVPDQEREHVFEKWYQSAGKSAKHHGLGLHFCQLVAEAHGGSIRVEGGPGHNSFVVALPAKTDLDGDDTSI